jgi:hypothetical protein
MTTTPKETVTPSSLSSWMIDNAEQAQIAQQKLEIWPYDASNIALLNEVHPYGYTQSSPTLHVRIEQWMYRFVFLLRDVNTCCICV